MLHVWVLSSPSKQITQSDSHSYRCSTLGSKSKHTVGWFMNFGRSLHADKREQLRNLHFQEAKELWDTKGERDIQRTINRGVTCLCSERMEQCWERRAYFNRITIFIPFPNAFLKLHVVEEGKALLCQLIIYISLSFKGTFHLKIKFSFPVWKCECDLTATTALCTIFYSNKYWTISEDWKSCSVLIWCLFGNLELDRSWSLAAFPLLGQKRVCQCMLGPVAFPLLLPGLYRVSSGFSCCWQVNFCHLLRCGVSKWIKKKRNPLFKFFLLDLLPLKSLVKHWKLVGFLSEVANHLYLMTWFVFLTFFCHYYIWCMQTCSSVSGILHVLQKPVHVFQWYLKTGWVLYVLLKDEK